MQRLKLEATLNVHDGCVSDLYDSLLSYWFVSLCDCLVMFVGGWLGVLLLVCIEPYLWPFFHVVGLGHLQSSERVAVRGFECCCSGQPSGFWPG